MTDFKAILVLKLIVLLSCFFGYSLAWSRNIMPNRFKASSSATVAYSSTSSDVLEDEKSFILQPKIPKNVWRWPPNWPYQDEQFAVVEDRESKQLSVKAVELLTQHTGAFLKEKTNVLELSTSSLSALSSKDSSLSVTRLNLDENFLRAASIGKFPFQNEHFDGVIISSGIEAVGNPRDLLREIWRVLRPGGKAIISFASKKIIADNPVKIWTTTTDDQKIWVAGRYSNFRSSIEIMKIIKKTKILLSFF
jgi:SAM-dependent methyltransferase